jgi:hypothetical protein
MAALMEKRCSKCGIIKSTDQFFKNKTRSDGLSTYCKVCDHKRNVKYGQSNPVMVQTGEMLRKARRRAQEKGLAFDIDASYLRSVVPSHCPILGVELAWSTRRLNGDTTLPNSPSLDRIDPTKGYVKGNVWIVSARANRIKNDATHEELKLVTEAVGRAIVDSLEW